MSMCGGGGGMYFQMKLAIYQALAKQTYAPSIKKRAIPWFAEAVARYTQDRLTDREDARKRKETSQKSIEDKKTKIRASLVSKLSKMKAVDRKTFLESDEFERTVKQMSEFDRTLEDIHNEIIEIDDDIDQLTNSLTAAKDVTEVSSEHETRLYSMEDVLFSAVQDTDQSKPLVNTSNPAKDAFIIEQKDKRNTRNRERQIGKKRTDGDQKTYKDTFMNDLMAALDAKDKRVKSDRDRISGDTDDEEDEDDDQIIISTKLNN